MSGNSAEVTDASAFEQGSLGMQVLLAIVTLGVYSIYWVYKTSAQLAAGTDADVSPGVLLVLFIIPLVNIYAIWQFSNAAEAVTDQDGVVLFILFVVFAPAAWYLIQSGINEIAA